jgi:hypothetical protein
MKNNEMVAEKLFPVADMTFLVIKCRTNTLLLNLIYSYPASVYFVVMSSCILRY